MLGHLGINILHPCILILTKFNRWSHDHASTRPRTVMKVAIDANDIRYIIGWLAEHGEQISFTDYDGKTESELLVMVRKYYDKYADDEVHMELLRSVMTDHWDPMRALPPPEPEESLAPP